MLSESCCVTALFDKENLNALAEILQYLSAKVGIFILYLDIFLSIYQHTNQKQNYNHNITFLLTLKKILSAVFGKYFDI